MTIGLIGLGKMGSQIVARLTKAGHAVVVTDHHQENIDAAVANGATAAVDSKDLVSKLASPAVVWLMIASHVVDAELDTLLPLLAKGSIIVDGGNSDFRETRERYKRCAEKGVQLVDVGTSGGIMGLKNGFSMMIGGDEQAFTAVEPAIQALAQENGYDYFGLTGAGNYVKMIHNAIEYGIMESYAEGYRLLKDGTDYPGLDLASIAKVWQHGSIIASSLNDITAGILAKNPNLDGIDGYVAETGEARWTLEVAAGQSIPMPAVQAAFDTRLATAQGKVNFATKLLAAMRGGFGGHKVNK
ncbi:MAG TPA: decarboxylating 6-phosphogluconate dehydrogenase [Candidatus Saccharimonadales bacterium]|nr:decarboxylating 6-phosphogluconate dehydrogenase [Candidatus Saccharimonadales bacterium]